MITEKIGIIPFILGNTEATTIIETVSLKALLDRYIDILTPEEENKLRNFKNSL